MEKWMDFQTVDAIFVPLCMSLVYDIQAHGDENIIGDNNQWHLSEVY